MLPPAPGVIIESCFCVRRVLDDGPLGKVVEAEGVASGDGRACAVFLPAAGGTPGTAAALVEELVRSAADRGDARAI